MTQSRTSSHTSPRRSWDSHVTCFVIHDGVLEQVATTVDEVQGLIAQGRDLVWLDLVDPTDDDQVVLEEDLGLSRLAIEDATVHRERPKIEAYDGYWFLYILGTTLSDGDLVLHDLGVFAGEHFVVTIRRSPAYSLDDIYRRLQDHPDRCRQGVGFLLYTILDSGSMATFPSPSRF